VLNLTAACGPILFDLLSGYLYDSQAENNDCYGAACYQLYLLISSAMLGGALLLWVALFVLVWRVHNSTSKKLIHT